MFRAPVPRAPCAIHRSPSCAAMPAATRTQIGLAEPNVLDQVVSLLAAEPGSSSVRCSCTWLRVAYDRCNSRLVLRAEAPAPAGPAAQQQQQQQLPPSFRARILDLLRNSPSLISLSVYAPYVGLSWQEALEAGGPELRQRLESLCTNRSMVTPEGVACLSAYVHLTHLTLRHSWISDLTPLAAWTQLQIITLEECHGLQDLAPLAACVHLQQLEIDSCTDVAGLPSCPGLLRLSIRKCERLHDLRPLAACSRLRELELIRCPLLLDLRPVAACGDTLRSLKLRGCTSVLDLQPLASCTELRDLDLYACFCVHNLAPPSACSCLQLLDLSACGFVTDLTPLSACARLQRLELRFCWGVRRLAPLAACPALRQLNISYCPWVEDARHFSARARLRQLHVQGTQQWATPGSLAELAHDTEVAFSGMKAELKSVGAVPGRCAAKTLQILWGTLWLVLSGVWSRA